MKRLFARLALLACLLGPLRAADMSVAEIVGDRQPSSILRMIPDLTPPNQRLEGLVFVAGYEAVGKATPLDAAQAGRLDAMTKNPASFDSSDPEAKMRPGVAYRFGTGADFVDLLVCFSCDKVAVVPAGGDAIALTAHIIQPAREVLLGLAKELLPLDEAIQELPRVRSERPVPPPGAPVPKDAPRSGQPSP